MGQIAFISHASPDRETAEKICDYLERRGISCWIAPRDVRPGHEYAAEIMAGLADSQALVLVMSEHANTSIYVKREVERAVSSGKPVFPIRIREVSPSQSLEFFVASSQWIDAWKPPMEQYLDQLVNALQSVGPLGGGAPTTDQPSETAVTTEPGPRSGGVWKPALALVVVALTGVAGWYGYAQWQAQEPISKPEAASSGTPRSTDNGKNAGGTGVAPQAPESADQSGPAPPSRTAAAGASSEPEEMHSGRAQADDTAVSANHPQQFTDALRLLKGTSGNSRYRTIKRLVKDGAIPARLDTNEMLSLIEGSSYRTNALGLLVDRLPKPLSYRDAAAIVQPTQGNERYNTLKLLARHGRLPEQVRTDQTLALTDSSSYRINALGLFVKRLPKPLPFEATAQIVEPTKGNERYNTLKLLARHGRLPERVSVDQMLALTDSSSYRINALGFFVKRLPRPLPFEATARIVEPTKGSERYNTLKLLARHGRVPERLSSAQMLTLVESSNYRLQAIGMLVERLPQPLSYERALEIVEPTKGNERYNLLKLLIRNKRIPGGLSADQSLALVESSSYRQQALDMLSQ